MKTLTLIRHAKSSWDDFSISDHDRGLNARGEKDAPRVAAALSSFIHSGGHSPLQLCLSSTAVRAVTTARVFAKELGNVPVTEDGDLYLASPETMLGRIGQVDESLEHIAVFAHNPGMHHLAHSLLKSGGIDRFPTTAVAVISFETEYWGTIAPAEGELLWSVVPRELP